MRTLRRLVLFLALATGLACAQGFRYVQFTGPGTDIALKTQGTGISFHKLTWTGTGTIATCSVELDSSPDGVTWTAGGAIGAQACTSNGTSGIVGGTFNYVRIDAATLTGGGTLSVVWDGYVVNPSNGLCIATTSTLSSTCGTTKAQLATVTNGASGTDCTTGGGTTAVTCIYTGSAWVYAGSSSSTGVTSVTGDGALITNSGSTAAVTLTVGTALAHKYWGNNTGSTATAAFDTLAAGDIPAALSSTTSVNGTTIPSSVTWPATKASTSHQWLNSFTQSSGAFTSTQPASTDLSDYGTVSPTGIFGTTLVDFSPASQLKLPVGAGYTSAANGEIGYDSTNKNWHAWQTADSYIFTGLVSGSYTNNDCVKFSVSTGQIQLTDAGAACGTGGGSAFNSITTGTNTSATMTVGTGGTLTFSGSGVVNADEINGLTFPSLVASDCLTNNGTTLSWGACSSSSAFSSITTGVNTTATMTLGSGGTLTFSGTGVVNANQINSLTFPSLVNGDCLTNNGTTLSWGACGSGGSPAFNAITSGTNTSAAMLVGTGSTLGPTGSGTLTANAGIFPLAASGTVNSGGLLYANSTTSVSVSPSLTQDGILYGGGAGAAPTVITPPTTNSTYVVNYPVTSSAAVAPVASLPGVPFDTQSGSTYTVVGASSGSATPATDRVSVLQTTNSTTSTAVTIPQAGSSGFGSNYTFVHCNTGTVVATDTPTTSTVNGNSTLALVGAVSGHNPECAFVWSDNTNYWAGEILPTDSNGRLAAEGFGALTGDVTNTAGSYATTVGKVNGLAIPASATFVGTNSSHQFVSATPSFPLTVGGTTTSGGIPYFSSTTALSSSALLAANAIVVGGGAGTAPSTDSSATLSNGALSLGASGTLGSVVMGNATSGTLTVEPTTGAITSYTIGLPVAQPTSGNTFLSCTAANPAVCTWAAGGGGSPILSSIQAATGSNTIANGNNPQVWNFAQTTNSQTAFAFGDTSAATGTSDILLGLTTASGSTEIPFSIAGGAGPSGAAAPAATSITGGTGGAASPATTGAGNTGGAFSFTGGNGSAGGSTSGNGGTGGGATFTMGTGGSVTSGTVGPNGGFTIVGGTDTSPTSATLLSLTKTLNNASNSSILVNEAITETSDGAPVYWRIQGGTGAANTEFEISSGGIEQIATGITGTSATQNLNVCGGNNGSCGVSTTATAGGSFFEGANNSGTGAATQGGFGFYGGGQLSAATPNASALEGLTQLASGYLKGTAVAAVGDVVCGTTTAFTVTDCATTPQVNIIGVALRTTNPIGVQTEGTAVVALDGAVTAIGDTVCMGTTTAGKAHDSGGTAVCATAGTSIGVIIADSGTVTYATGDNLGTATATLASTNPGLVLVQLHIGK